SGGVSFSRPVRAAVVSIPAPAGPGQAAPVRGTAWSRKVRATAPRVEVYLFRALRGASVFPRQCLGRGYAQTPSRLRSARRGGESHRAGMDPSSPRSHPESGLRVVRAFQGE